MKKLLVLVCILGMLVMAGTAIAGSPPTMQGWKYLGSPEGGTHYTYKKVNSQDEFMLLSKTNEDDRPIYIKMDSRSSFKKNEGNRFWVCEKGSRDGYSDRFDCHYLKNGLDQFEECMHKADRKYNSGTVKKTHSMTRQQHNDFLWKVTTDMCKRNHRRLLHEYEEKSIMFAYNFKTYTAPNWGDEEQKAEQAEQELVNKSQQEFEQRETVSFDPKPSSQPQPQTSSKMKILKNRSGGCILIITNETVYNFDIRINGSSYGELPTRKVSRIGGLNCDGFMAEAWPQGQVAGSVHRAFQHNQKQGKTFNWFLKYNN